MIMSNLMEGNNKYRTILVILLSCFVLIIALAIIISNIDFKEKVNGTVAIILNEGDLTINYTDGNEIEFNDSKKHTYALSITNHSDKKIYYSVYFSNSNVDDIPIKVKDENGKVINTVKKDILNNKLINLYSINGNETVRYTIEIDSDVRVKFKGTLKVVNESMVTETFSDLILLHNNINVAQSRIGSEIATTDEGLLSTLDNKGTTYFFRGNVKNNYVKIGDLLFRVVRINGDSTVRLVLDGVLNETYPYNSNALVEGTHPSSLTMLNDATLKGQLETWLNGSIGQYAKYVVNGDYCIETNYNLNFNNIYYSSAYERIFNDEAPDLYCSGNVYTGKVGLLSADEVVFAGAASNKPNTKYYLYNKGIQGNYLTLSGYFINVENHISMMNVMSNGALGDGILVSNESLIRPVINISIDANIKGNGTIDNPYIIVS